MAKRQYPYRRIDDFIMWCGGIPAMSTVIGLLCLVIYVIHLLVPGF